VKEEVKEEEKEETNNKKDEKGEDEVEDDFKTLSFVLNQQHAIPYQSKVKLHGSNCALNVQYKQNSIVFGVQSRSQFFDRQGMGTLLFKFQSHIEEIFQKYKDDYHQMIIYGEYCGAKVQKGVALCKLKFNLMAVFAIQFNGQNGIRDLVIDPTDIQNILTDFGSKTLPQYLFVIPYYKKEEIILDFDFNDEKKLEEKANIINADVNLIDKEDPWVKATFNESGPGEGLVLYPLSFQRKSEKFNVSMGPASSIFTLMFKAKGKTHQMVTGILPAQIYTSVVESAEKYALLMVTEARLKQGAKEISDPTKENDENYTVFDNKNFGKFLKWILADVEKEGKDELKASNLDWKTVSPFVKNVSQSWFLKQIITYKK